MRHDVLDVIIPWSNPYRWKSRERLLANCVNHLKDTPRVRLTVVIQDHGNSCHEFDFGPNVTVIKVHGKTLLWTKENLINIGVSRLSWDWKYVCWLDGDIVFRGKSWAGETIHFLGHFPVVQPWQNCIDLGPNGEVLKVHSSFAYLWNTKPHSCHKMGAAGYELAHPGYAWAMTRTAFEQVGGLIEHCIMGAADHHMALALIGKAGHSIKKGIHPNYAKPIYQWEKLACKLGRMIHYVPCVIEHPFHGNKTGKFGRKYIERWDIPIHHGYDPETDIKYNSQGVLELVGNKPEMARKIHAYHAERNEDINAVVE